MSSRAVRKLTGKVKELTFVHDNTEESESENPGQSFASKFSLFGITNDDTIYSQSDSEQTPNVPIAPTKGGRKQRKKLNTKKKRGRSTFDLNSNICDLELPQSAPISTESCCIDDLLVVNPKLLDPFQELRRLFGSHVVGASKNIGNMDRRSHLKRGLLVRIKPSWPPVVRFGLDMIRSEDGTFTFTHSKEYYNTQKLFYAALETMDPNNIMQILTSCPYHIDSLLQLSEIMMHQDNSEVATDLLERALHGYQSAFHTSFNPVTSVFYLDYKRQENRGLFVALFRYINAIGTRGCYRNALDYSKILLSLDVEGDPLAVLLLIDHYALLAHQLEFLIRLYERLNPHRNLNLLPNFAYSVPLALHLESQSKSKDDSVKSVEAEKKLQDALIMFPGFVTRLLKHTSLGGVTNLDKSVLFGKELQTESDSLGRLLDLYVARTHPVWTSPEVLSWLERNLEVVLSLVEPPASGGRTQPDSRLKEYSKRRQSLYPALPRNVLRHLVLADIPEAPPLFLRGARTPQIYHFDPLPPQGAVNYCDPEEQRLQSRPTGSDRGFLYSLFTSLLPDDSLQRAMQQFAQPHNENDSEMAEPGAGQTLGLAAERLAASLRRVLEHIDPRRAMNLGTDANTETAPDEEYRPEEDR